MLVAGQPRARPLDTAHRSPVARWRFTPPPGLRYTPNEVEVPLQNREGFFVIEARRGDAVQQTWLDLTRVGLLTKESPGGIVLYGADLRSGKALAGMRVTYLVGAAFRYGKTDAHGIARWSGRGRPRFALAEWGRSKTFVAFLPQGAGAGGAGRSARPSAPPCGPASGCTSSASPASGSARLTGRRPAGARLSVVARGRTLAQPRPGSTEPARSRPTWRCRPMPGRRRGGARQPPGAPAAGRRSTSTASATSG